MDHTIYFFYIYFLIQQYFTYILPCQNLQIYLVLFNAIIVFHYICVLSLCNRPHWWAFKSTLLSQWTLNALPHLDPFCLSNLIFLFSSYTKIIGFGTCVVYSFFVSCVIPLPLIRISLLPSTKLHMFFKVQLKSYLCF